MPQLFSVRNQPIRFLLTFSWVVALSLTFIPIATGQVVNTESEKDGDDQSSIKLHVAGNLVVVRVAVRNSRGEPLGFSPDGKTLVSGGANDDIKLRDLPSGVDKLRLSCYREIWPWN